MFSLHLCRSPNLVGRLREVKGNNNTRDLVPDQNRIQIKFVTIFLLVHSYHEFGDLNKPGTE